MALLGLLLAAVGAVVLAAAAAGARPGGRARGGGGAAAAAAGAAGAAWEDAEEEAAAAGGAVRGAAATSGRPDGSNVLFVRCRLASRAAATSAAVGTRSGMPRHAVAGPRKPIMRCAASAPLLLLHARAVPRAPAPLAVSDGALVVVAAGLAGAAGWLQYSLSSGDKGLNAFLGREKMNNPFYSKDYVSEKPSAPRWLSNIRLPALPFVEVYGDSRSSSTRGGDDPQLAALYRQMDDAIESEAYDIAAKYKVKIDKMLAERAEDGRST